MLQARDCAVGELPSLDLLPYKHMALSYEFAEPDPFTGGDIPVPADEEWMLLPKSVCSRMQRGLPTFVLAGNFFYETADLGDGIKGYVSNHGLEVLIRAAPPSKVMHLRANIEANSFAHSSWTSGATFASSAATPWTGASPWGG